MDSHDEDVAASMDSSSDTPTSILNRKGLFGRSALPTPLEEELTLEDRQAVQNNDNANGDHPQNNSEIHNVEAEETEVKDVAHTISDVPEDPVQINEDDAAIVESPMQESNEEPAAKPANDVEMDDMDDEDDEPALAIVEVAMEEEKEKSPTPMEKPEPTQLIVEEIEPESQPGAQEEEDVSEAIQEEPIESLDIVEVSPDSEEVVAEAISSEKFDEDPPAAKTEAEEIKELTPTRETTDAPEAEYASGDDVVIGKEEEEPEAVEESGNEPEGEETYGNQPEAEEVEGNEKEEECETAGNHPEVEEAFENEPEAEEATGTKPEVEEATGTEPEVQEATGTEPEVEEATGTEPEVVEATGNELEVEEEIGNEPEVVSGGEEEKMEEDKDDQPPPLEDVEDVEEEVFEKKIISMDTSREEEDISQSNDEPKSDYGEAGEGEAMETDPIEKNEEEEQSTVVAESDENVKEYEKKTTVAEESKPEELVDDKEDEEMKEEESKEVEEEEKEEESTPRGRRATTKRASAVTTPVSTKKTPARARRSVVVVEEEEKNKEEDDENEQEESEEAVETPAAENTPKPKKPISARAARRSRQAPAEEANQEEEKQEKEDDEEEKIEKTPKTKTPVSARAARRSRAAAVEEEEDEGEEKHEQPPKKTPVSARSTRRSRAAEKDENEEKEDEEEETPRKTVSARSSRRSRAVEVVDEEEEIEGEEEKKTEKNPKAKSPVSARARRSRGAKAEEDKGEEEDDEKEQSEKPAAKTPSSARAFRRGRNVPMEVEEDNEQNEEEEKNEKTPSRRPTRSRKSEVTQVEVKEEDEESKSATDESKCGRRSTRTRQSAVNTPVTAAQTPASKSVAKGKTPATGGRTRGSKVSLSNGDDEKKKEEEEEEVEEEKIEEDDTQDEEERTPVAAKTPKSTRKPRTTKTTPTTTKTASPSEVKATTKRKTSDEFDPYDMDTEMEKHPEPLKNIQMEVHAFGAVKYAKLGTSSATRFVMTEKAAEARIASLSANNTPNRAKERRSLAEMTPGKEKSLLQHAHNTGILGNSKKSRAKKTSVAEEFEEDEAMEETTPKTAKKRKSTAEVNVPAKKAAPTVEVPVLSSEEQWKADHPEDEHEPHVPGARVYAIFNKVYYPAVVAGERDALSRFKVQFTADKIVKDVPAAGIVPLRAVVCDKQCFIDDNIFGVLACPNAASADQWAEGMFELEQLDDDGQATGEIISANWTQLSLDMNDWREYINKKSSEATAIVTENITTPGHSVRSNRKTTAREAETPNETPKEPTTRTPRTPRAPRATPARKQAEPKKTTPAKGKTSPASLTPEPAVEEKKPTEEVAEPRDPLTLEMNEEGVGKNVFAGKIFILTSANRSAPVIPDTPPVLFRKKMMQEFIESNGGVVTEQFSDVDDNEHLDAMLVSDTHYRTHKYLAALARAMPCVSHHWVTECANQGKCVDYTPYILPAGVSLLDEQVYPIPTERGFLLRGKRVFVHSTHTMLERTRQGPGSTFCGIWKPIIRLLGGDIVECEVDELPEQTLDIMLTDNTVKSSVVLMAEEAGAEVITSEWIIQSIIMSRLPPTDAHPRFKPEPRARAAGGSRRGGANDDSDS